MFFRFLSFSVDSADRFVSSAKSRSLQLDPFPPATIPPDHSSRKGPAMPDPKPSRPHWPDALQNPPKDSSGLKPWPWALERLEKSHNYWIATTRPDGRPQDRKSTRLNSSHDQISYAVFCLKKKNRNRPMLRNNTIQKGGWARGLTEVWP